MASTGTWAGEIDLPLLCDWLHRPRQKVDLGQGKPSSTRWSVLARSPERTRLALEPVTGRSHQLRVHCLALGHPLLGDELYAPGFDRAATPRLCLHARTLAFAHPTSGAWLSFTSATPF